MFKADGIRGVLFMLRERVIDILPSGHTVVFLFSFIIVQLELKLNTIIGLNHHTHTHRTQTFRPVPGIVGH